MVRQQWQPLCLLICKPKEPVSYALGFFTIVTFLGLAHHVMCVSSRSGNLSKMSGVLDILFSYLHRAHRAGKPHKCAMANNQNNLVKKAPITRVCAIDLGTHGSGYAIASKGSTRVSMHEAWPCQPVRYPKTRSALLYRGRKPVEFGFAAVDKYMTLTAEELTEYVLVQDFKLALEEASAADRLMAQLNINSTQVMADYLQLFTAYVKEQLIKEGINKAELDSIQWCLTVPAMWSDGSKQAMRTAAYRAGLIKSADSDALSIILEPEAAALHARNTNCPELKRGMTVCVLDVGGGTADITVHDVEEKGGHTVLQEALWAHGEMCGSVYVDHAFRAYYRERVGKDAFDRWAKSNPADLQQVMQLWETVKVNWKGKVARLASGLANASIGSSAAPSTAALLYGAQGSTSHNVSISSEDEEEVFEETEDFEFHRILIPPTLHATMSPADKEALHAEQEGDDSNVLLSQDEMAELFDTSINTILQTTVNHLKQLGRCCDVVVLVGGFAASPYLQQRVRETLIAAKLVREVVVPPQPYAAVLKGAVLYGLNPELITARRCRLAYGIRECAPFPDDAPQDSKFWHDEECCFYTDRVFSRLVEKGQQVSRDEEVRHYVVPLHAHQQSVAIQFYTTDKQGTKFIGASDPSMRQLGQLDVQLPPPVATTSSRAAEYAEHPDNRQVCVCLKFGHTELLASAYDLETEQPVETRFRFAAI